MKTEVPNESESPAIVEITARQVRKSADIRLLSTGRSW